MALEVFAKVDKNGTAECGDHIFVGRSQDLTNISKWLDEAFSNNKRKRTIKGLSSNFKNSSDGAVRLNLAECRLFHNTLTDLKNSKKKKSTPLNSLLEILDLTLCIY